MGAVVRSTALLKAIHRKFPGAQITWVTTSPLQHLLKGHELIDRVLTTSIEDLLSLSALEFDVALCIDKSLAAAGVVRSAQAKKTFGFRVESLTGAILPATEAATELWQIGLSNHKKFFENQKPETQLICEALELEYRREDYDLSLTEAETKEAQRRRRSWLRNHRAIVGLNTGCSPVIAYKKLTVEAHRKLIGLLEAMDVQVVLLGGPEDTERNLQIAKGLDAIATPTEKGLRDGMVSIAACDVVVTGDSLGMHLAIAMKRWVVAWFGPTCAHEIELYDRGAKVLASAPCAPCWRRSCQKETMCYDLVDLKEIAAAVSKGIDWTTSSFTQPSSATSFCRSPFSEPFVESGQPIESLLSVDPV
jgi:heptosyltransferase-2